MKEYFIQLCEYNHWANQQLHDFILKNISIDLANQFVKSSFKSLNEHLYHINDAEYIWINRIKGHSVNVWPSKNAEKQQFPETLLTVSESFYLWARQADEKNLMEICTYKNLEGKEFQNLNHQIVAHCMNHSTFHRGQIITLLHALDVPGKLPQTDLIYYFRSRNP